MGGKQKGGAYERELAKLLSLWWTEKVRDDVFWRTAGSGGMATNRGRRGKQAYGQHGDFQATDPIGIPLTRLIAIEAKRGYKDAHVGDVIDKPESIKDRTLETFFAQAERQAKEGKHPFWMLIIRRDKRQALVYMPLLLVKELQFEGAQIEDADPMVRLRVGKRRVVCLLLDQFFYIVDPDHIMEVDRAFQEA